MVDAGEAEAQLAEIWFHCWCDKSEAQAWAQLYAELAAEERTRVRERVARGDRSDIYQELRRLTEWAGVARSCALVKAG